MAAVSFIDDCVATCASVVSESSEGSTKPSLENALVDFADDSATTDIGQSSSDTEGSSGLSSDEGSRRRCRFGKTSLDTIPATPSAATMAMNSPPGFSRAAMREARDACKKQSTSEGSDMDTGSSTSEIGFLAPTGVTLSRFGETQLGTAPKTPVGKAKWKNLKSIIGSPPGLSFTESRRERDAHQKTSPTSWGGSLKGVCAFDPASRQAAAHGKLAKLKDEAALLKVLKSQNDAESDSTIEAPSSSSEPEEKITNKQQCRFGTTSLGTTPSTPISGEAAFPSPPGLSRKAMRQSRDAFKATVPAATSWGSHQSAAFTINPAGKPMTPPAERDARQRAARDAVKLGWGMPATTLSQTQAPR